MKTSFTVTKAEKNIYAAAFKSGTPVTVPGKRGKFILAQLDIKADEDNYILTVDTEGKVKRGKSKPKK